MTRTRELSKSSIRAAGIAAALAALAVLAGPGASAGAACANGAFRSGASAALPDCRAYELVSPADKNGLAVSPEAARAAADGSGIAFRANGAFPDSESAGFFSFYLSRRAAAAWGTDRVSPPVNPSTFITEAPFFDWTANLSRSAFVGAANSPLSAGSSATLRNLYLRDSASGALTLAGAGVLGRFGDPVGANIYGDGSADLESVAFASQGQLTPDAPLPPDLETNVYERTPTGLQLVSVLPSGEPATEGAVLGSLESDRNAVSDDGSRVIFTALPEGSAQVYVHVAGSATLQASASQSSQVDPLGPRAATFWTASKDGSQVLFTSSEKLTDDADTGAEDAGTDLYRFDTGTGDLTDLSAGSTGTASGAEVQGVVGAGDDGAIVYFVALGQLDGDNGVAGAPNLYVWHDGAAHFVATLGFDEPEGFVESRNWTNATSREALNIPSRVSADGREALITTSSTQPGFDNVDPVTGKPHTEVYRFDLDADPNWACVSCKAGAAASGDATIVAPELQVFNPSAEYMNRALTGGAVFFNSQERLTAGDENDVSDVYEWRDGEIGLISAGRGARPAFFADADVSGDNVYFTTVERLTAADRDSLADLYDARVGGGLPDPPAPPAPCEGGACRGPGPAPAAETPAASATFAGPGNPKHRKHARHRRVHQGKRHHKGGK